MYRAIGWMDSYCLPDSGSGYPIRSVGHEPLIEILQNEAATLKVGFEATGGQEWALWKQLMAAGVDAVQLPPAQIKAFARSRGTRAKTDPIDAELIARFMAFRPEAGRTLPMTGLAPVPHDSGTMRGKHMIAGGRRALWHVLYQAALAAAYYNPVLKSVAQRLKQRGKPHKLVIVAIARRLVTIANAILKTGLFLEVSKLRVNTVARQYPTNRGGLLPYQRKTAS